MAAKWSAWLDNRCTAASDRWARQEPSNLAAKWLPTKRARTTTTAQYIVFSEAMLLLLIRLCGFRRTTSEMVIHVFPMLCTERMARRFPAENAKALSLDPRWQLFPCSQLFQNQRP